LFLISSLNGFSLIKKHGVWRDNTELARINLNDLKFDSLETTTYKECVTFSDWSVAILEVGDKVGLCKVSCDTLNSVINGKDVDTVAIRDIRAGVD
jgi:hypothetical protein